MARTLLEMVQGILSTLDSDTVNSINETVESAQIVDIIKKNYFDIVEEYALPRNKALINFEALGDINKPNVLKIPSDVQAVLFWQYDKRLDPTDPPSFSQVTYMLPEKFLDMMGKRDSSDTTSFVQVPLTSTIILTVDKRQAPTYWTTFDDVHIVTDSFNAEVDATLQSSKTQVWAEHRHVFTAANEFIPDLSDNLSNLLYRTSENEAYALQKQIVNPKLEQKEKRLRSRANRSKYISQQIENNTFTRAPNYGRS